jgi:hypothetical protein
LSCAATDTCGTVTRADLQLPERESFRSDRDQQRETGISRERHGSAERNRDQQRETGISREKQGSAERDMDQ